MVDGPPTVPGEGAEKGKGRTGPGGAELQSQTGHQHPRSARAAASARPSPRLRTDSTSRQSPPRLSGQKIRDFSHSLARHHDGGSRSSSDTAYRNDWSGSLSEVHSPLKSVSIARFERPALGHSL